MNRSDVHITECGCARDQHGQTIRRCELHASLEPLAYATERINQVLDDMKGALGDVRFALLAEQCRPHPAQEIADAQSRLLGQMIGRLAILEAQAHTKRLSPSEIADKIRRHREYIVDGHDEISAGGGS